MAGTLRACGLAALLAAAAIAAAAQARFDFDATPGRLSKDVRPTRYALTLSVDPRADRFEGEATVTLTVRQPVPSIVLHAHQLAARSASLHTGSAKRPLAVQADEASQTWTLRPADGGAIAPGTHTLRMAYDGPVLSTGVGLYRATHQVDGQPARLLATQLEAVFARTVFPGFDEPAFRTVYELSVRAPRGEEVVANMPLRTRTPQGRWVVHRFAPTPPMPAYLLALAVGRFEALSGQAAGIPLRILTAPGKRQRGAYALETTQRLLPYYEAYFGVPYALPKLDQLAVPSGRWGAMEDWGLVSYAEELLLFDPATSDEQARRQVFGLVAHEVAHQWFGNLVTAASWDEIWLNEAFATWLAEKASHRFHPQWQVPLRRRSRIDASMTRDAGPATRAIRSGPVEENRVFDVFDDITYVKGGAVLAMLEQWIGPERFRRGIAAYMRERRFSNATAGDLWHHVGRAAGRDVAAVAASWTDQPGVPLVGVDAHCERGRTVLALSQQRFTLGEDPGAARWRIPVQIRHDGLSHAVLLEHERQTLTLPGCPAQPTLVNAGGEGFYRVAYSAPLHAALTERFAQLPPAAAVTLLSDAFELAQAGRLPIGAWFDLLAELPRVEGPGKAALWSTAREGLERLDVTFAGTPLQPLLHAAARALLGPELADLGWAARPGEDGEVQLLRRDLIVDLSRYGDPQVIARARSLFDADESGQAPLPPALRAGVVQATAMHADAPRFGQIVRRLLQTARDDDRWLYARALASVRDARLAEQVLSLALERRLPENLATYLPGLMAEHGPHGEAAYRFVAGNWPALSVLAGPMFGAQAWLLPAAAEGFADAEAARRLRDDQRRLAGPTGDVPAARIAARIEQRAAVRARESGRLEAPLRALARRLSEGAR